MDSKITADDDCSHVIKRCLLLGRKTITNLDSRLKSRDTTLPIKVHIVKAMVFPVVTCRYERWTIKRAEHRRIDAFKLWCTREVPNSKVLTSMPHSVPVGLSACLQVGPDCPYVPGVVLKELVGRPRWRNHGIYIKIIKGQCTWIWRTTQST